MKEFRSIQDVVDFQMCTGCGVCVYLAPDELEMVDVIDLGRRPISKDGRDTTTPEVLDACPGVHLAHDDAAFPPGIIESLRPAWGPVLAVWEGHAADEEIRRRGSSGGAATALALFALNEQDVDGVVHTAAHPRRPYENVVQYSRCRDELLDAAGSRYAPASPGTGLGLIESAQGNSVFIGKPCDVAGLRLAAQHRNELEKKAALVVSFFCAGTPSTRATLDLIRQAGVDPEAVSALQYRGNGWPGTWHFTAGSGESEIEQHLTYEESWGFLQSYRQWRCYICPDHTGEFSDVAVGDPWYRTPRDGEPGSSLIVARTQRGVDAVREAEQAGYLVLESCDPGLLPASQPNLLQTRGRLWGQLLALRIAGAPAPRYRGMPSFRVWMTQLSLEEKARSILGTLRRVRRRKLRSRLRLESMEILDPDD